MYYASLMGLVKLAKIIYSTSYLINSETRSGLFNGAHCAELAVPCVRVPLSQRVLQVPEHLLPQAWNGRIVSYLPTQRLATYGTKSLKVFFAEKNIKNWLPRPGQTDRNFQVQTRCLILVYIVALFINHNTISFNSKNFIRSSSINNTFIYIICYWS